MSENNCLKFKPIRSGLQLFLFQFLCSLVALIVIYLLPKSGSMDSGSDIIPFIGAMCGGQFYGSRMERKFPEFLDIKKIKIIALWAALIDVILSFIVCFLGYIPLNNSFDFIILFGGLILALPISYFISKFSIKSGVNRVRRKCKTGGQLTDTLG